MNKRELKAIAREALRNANGYAPAYNEITLLETAGDGQYILFSVGGWVYSFDSHTIEKREKNGIDK